LTKKLGLLVAAMVSLTGASLLPLQAQAGAAGNKGGLPGGMLVPATGAYLGVSGPNWQQRENSLGRQFDIVHNYHKWDAQFPSQEESNAAAAGRIPLISWAAAKTTSVNAGSQDGIIKARANDVKALGKPVFLEWFWEMDIPPRKSDSVSPAAFISAWKRIHTMFDNAGVKNVAWVWCPSAFGFKNAAALWYPGDPYVDWVCADGYNWAPTKPGAPWVGFGDIFGPAINFAMVHNKPMMIGEVAALERKAGDKAAWINQTRTALENQYTDVRAFVWYDVKHTALSTGKLMYDFRIDTSASAFSAFKALANDPYFNPKH